MTTTTSFILTPEEIKETFRMIIKEELSLIGSNGKSLTYGQQAPLFPIEQLIDYLPEHPARQTVYGWVNDRKIPFEKFGKRLYFRKSNIDKWLDNGRQIA